MVDPDAFSTALWTALVIAAFVVALSLAALADMAMRRREDRDARPRRPGHTRRGAAPPGRP